MVDAVCLETILVVDDDPMVLRVVTTILKRHTYKILEAKGPVEALDIEHNYSGVIDLLLSDISMPLMSGCQLADQIHEHRPETRVMFMSGGYDGALLLLNYGWNFLQKPFLKDSLLETVHETLHSEIRSQGTDHFDSRERQ
jgi:two-component system cell cycle sensor histidine kinase/response regulator CckA